MSTKPQRPHQTYEPIKQRRYFYYVMISLGLAASLIRFVIETKNGLITPANRITLVLEILFLLILLVVNWRSTKNIRIVEISSFFAVAIGLMVGYLAILINHDSGSLSGDFQFVEIVYWFPLVYLMAYVAFNDFPGFWISIAYSLMLFITFVLKILASPIIQMTDLSFIARLVLANLMIIVFIHFWSSISKKGVELEIQTRLYKNLAYNDHLTEIPNRRYMDELLLKEYERTRRTEDTFSIVAVDVDNFKSINDIYGHSTGDRVLARIADIGSSVIRSFDTIARIGGDEFLLLLPRTGAKEAVEISMRLQTTIEMDALLSSYGTRISYGVADSTNRQGIENMISEADDRMYLAKKEAVK